MKREVIFGALLVGTLACQLLQPREALQGPLSPTSGRPSEAPEDAAAPQAPGRPLAPIAVNVVNPFPPVAPGAGYSGSFAGRDYRLPLDLSQIANPPVVAGLTNAQIAFLAQNGFAVLHTQEEQFGGLREQVSRIQGQPYYLTTDAAFHALHLTFDDLLKALEREELRPLMIDLLAATIDVVATYPSLLAGTSIENDARQALAYLSVAQRLFDPASRIDPAVADLVERQVAQIEAAAGRGQSAIFPGFEDDYGAYKPVGHYAGDPDLEAYFRGMIWLGRVHLKLEGSESSRLPLLVTLALRRAQMEGRPAAEAWATVHEVLSFIIGPSDDGGPAEYAVLMDQVYGDSHGPLDIADDARWQDFIGRADGLPAPQINSTFVDSLDTLEKERGWRLLGQRFTLDAFVLQNLVFDKVRELDGRRRMLPSGLDVMAALGSPKAQEALEQAGETAYPNYREQMATLTTAIQAQPESQWLSRFYDSWLYTFFPVLQPKGDAYPSYMQTDTWGYKDLNAALGSWAELKHDTVLYSKMPEGAGGGGPPCVSGPAPGYVEPNPQAFYRLAALAKTLVEGLAEREMNGSGDAFQDWDFSQGLPPPGLTELIEAMAALGGHLETLGDIAVKELAGEPLTVDDYAAIQRPLGLAERLAGEAGSLLDLTRLPAAPIVAAVAGGGGEVLEAATGYIDRIYVVVSIQDRPYVAQGGAFSYYEFSQPRDQRLTDEEWRERLASDQAPPRPAWSSNLILEGGSPVTWLAFRVGEVYIITQEGQDLNLREGPSLSATVLRQLRWGEYIEIIGGPVDADGHRWWEFNVCGQGLSGWAVEHQDWYERGWR